MVNFRFNPNKAGTTEFGHSRVNDCADCMSAFGSCYKECGCIGVALLAITGVGAAILFGAAAGSSSSSSCWEVCSYDSIGRGVCQCLFGGK